MLPTILKWAPVWIYLFIAFLCAGEVRAQQGAVTGTLTNQEGQALPERFVALESDSQSQTQRTDATGSFRFQDLEPGLYALYPRFEAASSRWDFNTPVEFAFVADGETISVDLQLYEFPTGRWELAHSIGNYPRVKATAAFVDFVLETSREVPAVDEFPQRGGLPLTMLGRGDTLIADISKQISRLIGTPVRTLQEPPFKYVITWFQIERDSRLDRYRRNAYLIRVTDAPSNSTCSHISINWMSESCGFRERTWRTTEEDRRHVPAAVSKLSQSLTTTAGCS